MSDNTKIEWADATVNAVNGCSLASPGCTNCYAMRLAGTRMKHHPSRAGLTMDTKAGPVWTGEVRLHEPALLQPLRWKRPRRIFWNAHGDLFHPAVPDEWIDRVLASCAATPQHVHMILTKRSARMREYMARALGRIADLAIKMRRERGDNSPVVPLPHVRPGAAWWPLPNVWLGVSVEDQARADERIPDLLATPAAVRFISAEPLLGLVDMTRNLWGRATPCTYCSKDADCGCGFFPRGACPGEPALDWVIVGGESGPGARPMHPDWARSLRDQCAAAGVPFHFKQWGAWSSVFDRERDDPDWRDCSRWERKFPKGQWLNLAGGTGFHGENVHYVAPVGKKAAGRLLDGVEHNGFPEVRPCSC